MTIMDYVALSSAKPRKSGDSIRARRHRAWRRRDIAVVDLAREMVLDDAKLQSRAKITPWHGRKVKGLPVHTLVRGRFVMRDRTLVEGTRGTAARAFDPTHGGPRPAQYRPNHGSHPSGAGPATESAA